MWLFVMNYSLNKLLRKGHVIEMGFNIPRDKTFYYMHNGIIVNVVDNTLLTEDVESCLMKDWSDDKLLHIYVIVSNLDTKKNNKVLAWNKTNGEFDWPSINKDIRCSRLAIGFCDTRLMVNEQKVLPLKVLAATTYRNYFGILMSHEISHLMDFETHEKVLRKTAWRC